ncbi:polysialyltransferase family glycosyltransferase [Vogesella amnigena]|uniref:Polysialyltransferase family glycosyltransferase n=1 Tax=Vogesella amnigena TaxID=1507449 RepID=A0ABV7TU47_9NEIS
MIITFFVSNVYQLAVSRAVISLFRPRSASVVYCSEFINKNNPFLRYMGGLEVVDLLSVSEMDYKRRTGILMGGDGGAFNPEVKSRVMESDLVLFGDPYLLSQRSYVAISKSKAMIEDSPTLFSYFRYRSNIPVVKRWLAEQFGLHPLFDAETPCYGFSTFNNCYGKRYINTSRVLEADDIDKIKGEIRGAFKTEFDSLEKVKSLNQEDTILLLTQPLASDGIVTSVNQQIEFYMTNMNQLRAAGFRVLCKLHPRDIANGVSYPIGPNEVFNFSAPMELFEDEIRNCFVGIAAYSSYSFVESTKFVRIKLSL